MFSGLPGPFGCTTAPSIWKAAPQTLNVRNTSNLVIRNLRFDELWEWDEQTRGDYTANGWDFITLGDGGPVSNVSVDHCSFTKSYDGIVDRMAGV